MPVVEGVYVAIVQEMNEEEALVWNVYLVNDKQEAIENAFVSSKGYLEDVKGVQSKTSTLRHYFKEVPSQKATKVEPIMEDVFKLNNEYFVSFYHQGILFDKKFVFLAESIKESNMSIVPVVDKKGIWIK